MKTTLHKADTRGHVDFGWLNSHHSFSFGHYYDPERIHFGALRVLNDDIVKGGGGFPMHPHDNMEIVSISLHGSMEHKDSTGGQGVIMQNDVQIMSAGSGIKHSEANHSKTEVVNFLQVWVLPKKRNVQPRYDQKTYLPEQRENAFQTIVAPDNENAVWINQDAWFSLGNFLKDTSTIYKVHKQENGVYIFVINGEATINDVSLNRRDGLGVAEADALTIKANADVELLLIEVPMQLN